MEIPIGVAARFIKPAKVMIGVPLLRMPEGFHSFMRMANAGYEFVQTQYQAAPAVRGILSQTLLERADATHLLVLEEGHEYPLSLPSRLLKVWEANPILKVICAPAGTDKTAAVLIHRSIFELVKPPWFLPMAEPGGINMATDYASFFTRLQRYGVVPHYCEDAMSINLDIVVEAKTPSKVLIGVPYLNTASIAFWSFVRLAAAGYTFVEAGRSDTASMRNRFAQSILAWPDVTHLLMLDEDHVHPTDLPARLMYWWQDDQNRKIIAALVFRRPMPHDPLALMENAEGKLHPLHTWPAGLIKVDVCATSAMLVHRSVFETIPPPWFFSEPGENGMDMTTEDYPFCRKARRHGHQIWVDTITRSPHLGTVLIGEDSYRANLPKEGPPIQNITVPLAQ